MDTSDIIDRCAGLLSILLSTRVNYTQHDRDKLYALLFCNDHPCNTNPSDLIGIEYRNDVDKMIDNPLDIYHKHLVRQGRHQLFHPSQLKQNNHIHSIILQGEHTLNAHLPFRLEIALAESMLVYPTVSYVPCKNGDECRACREQFENQRMQPLPPMSHYHPVFADCDVCFMCYRTLISMEKNMHELSHGSAKHLLPITYHEDFGPNGYSDQVAGRVVAGKPLQVGDHSLYDVVKENSTLKFVQFKTYTCNRQHLN